VADRDDGSFDAGDDGEDVLSRRARREPLVDRELGARRLRDRLRRLARTQQRAREDERRRVVCEPLGERQRLPAAAGAEGAQPVGLAGLGVGVRG
jgi:hypothetical protein